MNYVPKLKSQSIVCNFLNFVAFLFLSTIPNANGQKQAKIRHMKIHA